MAAEPGVVVVRPEGPRQSLQAVVVGGGKAVFGRQAVVNGDHHDARPGGEAGEEEVEAPPGGGADAEPAAVEVEEEGELLVGLHEGQKEARPEACGRVDEGVHGGGPVLHLR